MGDYAILIQMGDAGALMAALLLGHVLGDFVFQTDRMVRNKAKSHWLIRHAAELTFIHAVFLIPFLTWAAAPLVLGIGALHGLIDRFKGWMEKRSDRPVLHFAADQALHLLVLLLAWNFWPDASGASWHLPPRSWMTPFLTSAAVVASAYAFVPNGGAAIVGALLRSRSRPASDGPGSVIGNEFAMGRLIGILERTLLLTLVLTDQWGALGLVLAAKSIARFRDLQERNFAEYYLVGTLASVLVAVITGLTVKLLV